MRKILMFGTMLGVASAALAFGGVFNHGSKSTTYKGGVDAIGVHIGGEEVPCAEHSEKVGGVCQCVEGYVPNEESDCVANQCLEFAETDCVTACNPVTGEITYADNTTSCGTNKLCDGAGNCNCAEGYELNGSECLPVTPFTCAKSNFYWCVNSQTCVANKDACLELCPEARKCGGTCCNEDNICVDGNKCCHKNYDGDDSMCCSEGQSAYAAYGEGDDYVEIQCCSGTPIRVWEEDDGYVYKNACCETGRGEGYVSSHYQSDTDEDEYDYYSEYACCDGIVFKLEYPDENEVQRQGCCSSKLKETGATDSNGNPYYTCGCTSNAECGENEYCHQTGPSCYKPVYGTCEKITSDSYQSADIEGLGTVIMSNNSTMSWWAADNWCKAQGMRLLTVEELGCYQEGANIPITTGSGYHGSCCSAGGVNCGYGNSDIYVMYQLFRNFGHFKYIWTSSDAVENDSCEAFRAYLGGNKVYRKIRQYDLSNAYALCVSD